MKLAFTKSEELKFAGVPPPAVASKPVTGREAIGMP